MNKFVHVENLSEKSGQVFLKFLVKLSKWQYEGKKSNCKFPLKIKSDKPSYWLKPKVHGSTAVIL